MKRIILLTALICGSAYSMDSADTQIALKKIEVALQILSMPEHSLKWLCPHCGATGGVAAAAGARTEGYCAACKVGFSSSELNQDLRERAGYTLVRLKHLLPKQNEK